MLHSARGYRWVTSTSHYWLKRHGSVTILTGLTIDGLTVVVNDGLSISMAVVAEFMLIHTLVDSAIECNRSLSYSSQYIVAIHIVTVYWIGYYYTDCCYLSDDCYCVDNVFDLYGYLPSLFTIQLHIIIG